MTFIVVLTSSVKLEQDDERADFVSSRKRRLVVHVSGLPWSDWPMKRPAVWLSSRRGWASAEAFQLRSRIFCIPPIEHEDIHHVTTGGYREMSY
jgi:hypothetical protein